MSKQRVWDRKEVIEGHLFSLNKAVLNIPALKTAFLFFFCREVVNCGFAVGVTRSHKL